MFSNDDVIYAYTTEQAVLDGTLIKADPKLSSRAAINFPVYFTDTVWNRYVKVPKELDGIQDQNGRLWDILFMFVFQAKKCSDATFHFKFTCQVPKSSSWLKNESKSDISFQFREVVLKAVIGPQDLYDYSPAIFIMLPWED
ncbi:MAG: DUF6573 family protein [Mariniphaga sp.]|nr:hypothetical protein [Prolixibacteraceae bacterium]MDD4426286.1 hypothetical protein [Mariniphaga sp.]